MAQIERFAPLAGRILLALIFVVSGFGKITGFEGTAGYMEHAGMPMPQVLLVIAIILEFGGGILLVLGFKAKLAAAGLILFTLVATYFFHPAWANPDEQIAFMKNLGLIGGLLYVFAHGAGPFSLDSRKPQAPPAV